MVTQMYLRTGMRDVRTRQAKRTGKLYAREAVPSLYVLELITNMRRGLKESKKYALSYPREGIQGKYYASA